MATTSSDIRHSDIKQDTIIDHQSNISDSSKNEREVEKGDRVAAAYPLNDEDYVVTAKTWTVVVVLACAYGVRFHCQLLIADR
jgi:hypothetical protein